MSDLCWEWKRSEKFIALGYEGLQLMIKVFSGPVNKETFRLNLIGISFDFQGGFAVHFSTE